MNCATATQIITYKKRKKKKNCKVTYESGYVHLPNDCI